MTNSADSSTHDPIRSRESAHRVVRALDGRSTNDNANGRTSGDASPRVPDPRLVALVQSARAGDDRAWAGLVERFEPMLRSVLSTYRLPAADVDDVVQGTWMKLFTHIDRIREPAAIAGWLATTARRQALELLQTHTRELLTDEPDLGAVCEETPEQVVLDGERHDAFVRALAVLPDRQRRLVTLLAAQPALDYEQVGSILEMPVGSIGPTRARGLAKLERDSTLRALVAA
jgi:RNA polymerase sigma factor (sigma-70 family)